MFKLNATINGKPLTRGNLENELYEVIIEDITEKIESVLTTEEISQITFNFQGNFDRFSLNISGDNQDLVEKATKSLDNL
jgi:hypothetical protein